MKECSRSMAKKMEEQLQRLERLRLAEYVAYLEDRKRMLRVQFLMGLARGVGTAVGFTILGALLVLILQRLAEKNLPLIGDFLAELVRFVQKRLELS